MVFCPHMLMIYSLAMALLSRRWIRAADRPSVLLNLSVPPCKYLSRRFNTKGYFLALGSIYIACLFYDKLLSVLCTFTVSQCGQTACRDQLWRVCRRAPGQRLGQPQRGEFTVSSACLTSACAVSACTKTNMDFRWSCLIGLQLLMQFCQLVWFETSCIASASKQMCKITV